MNDRYRFAVAGGLLGAVLGAYFVSVQYGADVRGLRILGVVELMSLVSRPLSVVSWLVVLALAELAAFAGVPPEAETPRAGGLAAMLSVVGLALFAVTRQQSRDASAERAA